MTLHRNFCSACAVTVLSFSDTESFYLLNTHYTAG